MAKLNTEQVRQLLNDTVESFPHDLCLTCECFLGLVAQLRVDSEADGKALLAAYQVERINIHSCLGCDPCPPGDKYAAYMLDKRKPALITL